jgi:hypothetical protein
VSELDIGLKLATRKLLWFAGYASRLNVVLSTIVSGGASKSTKSFIEGFTDIDVLGVYITPELHMTRAIADCKTTQSKVAERLYWIAGVREFVSADSAYMVRLKQVTRSARQLAERLDLTILTPEDMTAFQHGVVDSHSPRPELDPLFDVDTVAMAEKLISGLPSAIDGMKSYRKNLFWMLPAGQNLQQMVSQLLSARMSLDPSQKGAQVMFSDCLWLYLYCLFEACSAVRKLQLSNVPNSLRRHMFGGDIALQEREHLMSLLKSMRDEVEGNQKAKTGIFELTPPYFADLVEIVSRMVRNPHSAVKALRLSEYILYCVLIAGNAPAEQSLEEFDPITAKLVVDVAAFLCKAANLDGAFLDRTQSLLAGTSLQKISVPSQPAMLPAAAP